MITKTLLSNNWALRWQVVQANTTSTSLWISNQCECISFLEQKFIDFIWQKLRLLHEATWFVEYFFVMPMMTSFHFCLFQADSWAVIVVWCACWLTDWAEILKTKEKLKTNKKQDKKRELKKSWKKDKKESWKKRQKREELYKKNKERQIKLCTKKSLCYQLCCLFSLCASSECLCVLLEKVERKDIRNIGH